MKLYDFDGMFDEKLTEYISKTLLNIRKRNGKT